MAYRKREGKTQLCYWLPDAVHKRVKAAAKRAGVPMSTWIQGLVASHFKAAREASRAGR